MKKLIDMTTICQFARELTQMRELFPEFAKEIDRCIYDVGQNHLGDCGHEKCECQQTFEQFHARQNIYHGTTKEEQNYGFN